MRRSLVFLLSFCSLGYELSVAKFLSDVSMQTILSQSLSIGFYVLALGIGSWYRSQRKPGGWENLLIVELGLALLGGLSIYLLMVGQMFSSMYLDFNFYLIHFPNLYFFVISLALLSLLGLLSGQELVLLIDQMDTEDKEAPLLLGINYFGGMVAALVLPLLLFSRLPVHWVAVLLGFLNLMAAVLILLRVRQRFWVVGGVAVLLLMLVFMQFRFLDRYIESRFKKNTYISFKMNSLSVSEIRKALKLLDELGEVQRHHSPYQTIDLVGADLLQTVGAQGYFLFLNGKLQVNSRGWRRYHESIVYGGLNLLGRPAKRVAILGGGDGLIARLCLEANPEIKIDLIELDPKVLELAKENQVLSALNQGALQSQRVDIKVRDAFEYVKNEKVKYDIIFMDFPFPTNFDLLRLYSVEFYRSVRQRLRDDGVAIFDFPIDTEALQKEGGGRNLILLHTLAAAGFDHPLVFGPVESFVAISRREEALTFNYKKLVDRVSNATLVNLASLEFEELRGNISASLVNSIFRPKPIRWEGQ